MTGRREKPSKLNFPVTADLSEIRRQTLGAALVFATLATAVYSVEKVIWVNPQPSLLMTLLLSVFFTLSLTMVKMPAIVRHAGILLTGAIIYIWQLSSLVDPQPWWQALRVKPNETTVYFTSFLMWGCWLTGYISTWFILQRQNAWAAIFLGATIILANLNNLPPKEYYRFFPIFVFAAVLLLGYTHMEKQFSQPENCAKAYSKTGTIYYAGIVIVLSVLVSFSAFFLPDIKLDSDASIASKISWNSSRDQWYNIFADVNEKPETAPVAEKRNTDIRFSDPPSEDKTLLFSVNADTVKYLRVRRYDNYLSNEWTSANTVDNMFDPQGMVLATHLLERKELTFTVANKNITDTFLVTGELKTISLPALLQINPTQPSANTDIVSVISARQLSSNETYSVTAWVSQAGPLQLYEAGTDYPDWVKQHYLQLPAILPERVKSLSVQITEDAQTPYEKALNIKNFLQRFSYNVIFNSPPDGVDAVDYFLFEKKAGDCTYFSSSMAVMLRSVGVPARISSGYRLLENDGATGQYLVRARDYHARAEVYFPGYGWIEFEATPGLPGLAIAEQNVDIEEILFAANSTQNVTMNATQRVKVNWVTYDEEGNLLDEFGNPIHEDAINPGALPPNLLPPGSPNATANISPNATKGAAQNGTANTSVNLTANLTANATQPASQNGTRPAAQNTTANISKNATPGGASNGNGLSNGKPLFGAGMEYPPFLLRLGLISLIGLFSGIVLIVIYHLWLNRIKRIYDVKAVYSRMCMLASLSKSGPKAFETPAEYGLRLGLVLPGQGQTIGNITQLYGESRFGKEKDLPAEKRAELEKSWVLLYPELVKRVFRFG